MSVEAPTGAGRQPDPVPIAESMGWSAPGVRVLVAGIVMLLAGVVLLALGVSLGPNGAGKTTAIECAIGLRRPDAGTIRLLGLDPHADQDQVHELVGVQLQSGALPAKLRVGEILEEGVTA